MAKPAGRFGRGDTVTVAGIVLMSLIVVARVFKIEVAGTPAINRIAALCGAQEAFSKADPMRQEGAAALIAPLDIRAGSGNRRVLCSSRALDAPSLVCQKSAIDHNIHDKEPDITRIAIEQSHGKATMTQSSECLFASALLRLLPI